MTMNKSNQLEPMLNAFLSDLAVLNIKVHNLHWNVEGREFALIHEMTEKIYKMLQDQFDETAEVMKMQCEMPLGTMAEYLKNTQIKEISSCNYSVAEVLDFLDEDCRLLISRAEEVRETADKQDNYQIANLLEDYLALYAKSHWMLTASRRAAAMTE